MPLPFTPAQYHPIRSPVSVGGVPQAGEYLSEDAPSRPSPTPQALTSISPPTLPDPWPSSTVKLMDVADLKIAVGHLPLPSAHLKGPRRPSLLPHLRHAPNTHPKQTNTPTFYAFITPP